MVAKGTRHFSKNPDTETYRIKSQSLTTDVFTGFIAAVKQFGWRDIWKQLRQCKEAKVGTLVGTDKFGNRYYENREDQYLRDRWVVYNTEKIHMDYDPALVPPEWHGWLHHITDTTPDEIKRKHGDAKFLTEKQYSEEKQTGRDVNYKNPGHLLGGRARGDGYLSKSGSVRPAFEPYDPKADNYV
ncbi:hypothetical protein GUITHDRAFT_112529 [Guillardia theta CCMP2712]|uniref:NADH dehydrogenase [ubiquinone] 1 alpha subcomplex subunit 12 n=1 Tax=Guillardia theta (strain CCMP2712) TaxID=905079 RepID=L1IYI1_GUITC|nr:hypothetical protein GUITHDRAFT_112529 [Guillardia theta CCMP2712]EKX41318.1 hypothetical protein GUITHDRAFT_112529 [Guillardia theta CCMP2712]|eukprot:XP_005828298.1 hypothetical protein GUITHDRAFT_112529 [Guillardia theta CCMP2712]